MKKFKILFLLSLLLSGCTFMNFDRWSVKQGNVVSESKLKRLKIGMSKDEVALLIGNSLLNSPFNNDRWDYVYFWGNALGKIEQTNVSLYFSRDNLVRVEQASSTIA